MATKKMAMVINMQKCVGCGACAMACKTENNTQGTTKGQSFNWADFHIESSGKFPNVNHVTRPVLCNHCDDAACLKQCPEPRALYKTEEGITMYNQRYCIQCRKCFSAKGCPYSSENMDKDGRDFTVISFNEVGAKTHDFHRDDSVLIKGGTSSPKDVSTMARAMPPSKHTFEFKDTKSPEKGQKSRGKGTLADVREDGWVDKCHFCIHRVRNGEDPYCVVSCPANARVFGDINDPRSEVSKLVKKYKPERLKNSKGELLSGNEKGTGPNVYYIRNYKADTHPA